MVVREILEMVHGTWWVSNNVAPVVGGASIGIVCGAAACGLSALGVAISGCVRSTSLASGVWLAGDGGIGGGAGLGSVCHVS